MPPFTLLLLREFLLVVGVAKKASAAAGPGRKKVEGGTYMMSMIRFEST